MGGTNIDGVFFDHRMGSPGLTEYSAWKTRFKPISQVLHGRAEGSVPWPEEVRADEDLGWL